MPTWKPFYDEVARNVLTFENRQGELLALVREMQNAGLHTITLRDKDAPGSSIELAEIDPFTFLANFHLSGEPSRRANWEFLRNRWNLSQPIPSNFDGVPTLLPQGSWYFPYAATRKTDDVSTLWKLAHVAVENPAALSDELFSRCLETKGVGLAKLTMGLFWLNAEAFLSLDSTNAAYLRAQGIDWDEEGIVSGLMAPYRALINAAHEKLGYDHPQISADAWTFKQVPRVKPTLITPQTRFWKLSPGENAYLWQQWRDNDYCSVGWPDLGNVAQMSAAELEARRAEIVNNPEQYPKAHRYAAESVKQVWQFVHVIKPGDFIVANQGTKKVLGIGIVTGPCEYHPEEERYPYRLPVRWFDITEREVQQGGWRSTLIELTRAKFDAISNAKTEEAGAAVSPVVGPARESEIRETVAPPLNKILYGPPGTGKTYTTIEEAVRIIRGDLNLPLTPEGKTDHAACKRDFDALREAGRIGFATFHQSFSYEEFVEGIRPVLDGVGGSARYICRDGILKDIALRALGASLAPVESGRVSFSQVWEYFIEHAEATPDWTLNGLGNSVFQISVSENQETIFGENIKGNAAKPYRATRSDVEKVWEKLPDNVYPAHQALYDILQKGSHTHFIGAIILEMRRLSQNLTPQKEKLNEPLATAKSYLRGSHSYRLDAVNAPRFVLIIDEINRGNISKILGELITLLEDDKRLGTENSLKVTLPTSNEWFALPPNLFLVGTMNTADKGLALLDIALRRRFTFQEMPPRFEVCTGLNEKQRAVLAQLNTRLTQSRDREHRIGHAYFTGSTVEFDQIFRDKIVPLLQEFFYNDWDGLRFVLGESGNDGKFIRALPDSGGGRSRTRWQWWFDLESDGSPTTVDFCDALYRNYKLAPAQTTATPTVETPAVAAATGTTLEALELEDADSVENEEDLAEAAEAEAAEAEDTQTDELEADAQ